MENIDSHDKRVALLVGGVGGEREISLASGRGAEEALKKAGYSVTILDPSHTEDLNSLLHKAFDVAFICLHGKKGEDGIIQGFLETINLPYIGSGVLASALAMDKVKSKLIYEKAGLNTPPSLHFSGNTNCPAKEIFERLGQKVVVKPSCEGSALGVFIVESEDELRQAFSEVSKTSNDFLVETYIKGKELTVAVLGSDKPRPLPIIEIIPTSEFYDYRSKYKPGASKHLCPAPLPLGISDIVQQMAVSAHQVLGCKGVSRSDIILDSTNEPWLLETNTIPGMTETSLLPDAARVAGMSFSDMCTFLIEDAIGNQ